MASSCVVYYVDEEICFFFKILGVIARKTE